MPMRGHGNVTVGHGDALDYGIRSESTCCRGYPRFNPGEFSTVDLLVRGDNDAALSWRRSRGDHAPAGHRPPERIPTCSGPQSHAHEPAGPCSHHHGGDRNQRAGNGVRMDEVPLPLRPALHSPYPTDQEVIRRIRQAVAAKRRGFRPRTESCQ